MSARAVDEDDAFWVTALEYFDQTTPDHVWKLGFDLQPRLGELAFSSRSAVSRICVRSPQTASGRRVQTVAGSVVHREGP